MHDKLLRYMQIALSLAEKANPMLAEQIGADIMATMGGLPVGNGSISSIGTDAADEAANVVNARARSREAVSV